MNTASSMHMKYPLDSTHF